MLFWSHWFFLEFLMIFKVDLLRFHSSCYLKLTLCRQLDPDRSWMASLHNLDSSLPCCFYLKRLRRQSVCSWLRSSCCLLLLRLMNRSVMDRVWISSYSFSYYFAWCSSKLSLSSFSDSCDWLDIGCSFECTSDSDYIVSS